jgi:hypothetical protein
LAKGNLKKRFIQNAETVKHEIAGLIPVRLADPEFFEVPKGS